MKVWPPFLQILIALLLFQTFSLTEDRIFSNAYIQLLESVEKVPRMPEKCNKINTSMSMIPSTYQILNDSNSTQENVNSLNSTSNLSLTKYFKNYLMELLDPWIVFFEEVYSFFCEIIQQTLEAYNFGPTVHHPVQYSQNFASLDGGAMILQISNSNIKSSTSILDDNNDKYLFTSAKLPIELVISLKEQVSIERIVLKSNQYYSSTINAFQVYGSFVLHGEKNNWFKLVEANARNVAGEQNFRTINKVVRFLKLRILSAHGMWRYFTMNQIKVYGNNIYAQAMNQKVANQVIALPEIDTSSVVLYGDIEKMITLSRNGSRTIPQNNLMKYFFQELSKLGRLQEKQILYLNNITKKIADLESELEEKAASKIYLTTVNFNEDVPNFMKRHYEPTQSYTQIDSPEQKVTQQLYPEIERLKKQVQSLKNKLVSTPQVQQSISQTSLIIVCILSSFLLTIAAFLIVFACMSKHSKISTGTNTQKDEQNIYMHDYPRQGRKYKGKDSKKW